MEGISNFGKIVQRLHRARDFALFDAKVTPASVQRLSPITGPGAPPLSIAVTCKTADQARELAGRVVASLPKSVGCLVFGQSVIVSLASDDSALREQLFTEFAKEKRLPFVHRSDDGWLLSLSAKPGQAGLEELENWCAHPAIEKIPAPWDPTDDRTPAQKAEDQELGALCREMREREASDDPSSDLKAGEEWAQKYSEATRRGDRETTKRMDEERKAQEQARFTKRIELLKTKYPKYASVLDGCLAESAKSGTYAGMAQFPKLVAPMMRQTTSQSSLYSAKHGNLYRMPRILSISVSPVCMEVAGPAIVQYLADHGVGECDYSLTSSGPDGMLEED